MICNLHSYVSRETFYGKCLFEIVVVRGLWREEFLAEIALAGGAEADADGFAEFFLVDPDRDVSIVPAHQHDGQARAALGGLALGRYLRLLRDGAYGRGCA